MFDLEPKEQQQSIVHSIEKEMTHYTVKQALMHGIYTRQMCELISQPNLHAQS